MSNTFSELLNSLQLNTHRSGTLADDWLEPEGSETNKILSPITGEQIAEIASTSRPQYEKVIQCAQETFTRWAKLPAPRRGDIVAEMGRALADNKDALGRLITIEMGKPLSEGLGEVQESIDMAQSAAGLSRSFGGKTLYSERPDHAMREVWHPLGVVGCITAFNFPQAVWAWNATIGAICGDPIVWKPSPDTPLTAIATLNILRDIARSHGYPGLFTMIFGGAEVGSWLAADSRLPLISATGSCNMGLQVQREVANTLGRRALLELGGNNALVVMPSADLEQALIASLFGAMGTTGQRCTSTRRLIVHEEIYDRFVQSLVQATPKLRIGNPLDSAVVMGPLRSREALDQVLEGLKRIESQGGKILCGGKPIEQMPSNCYFEPAVVEAEASLEMMQEELFGPVSYVVKVRDFDEALSVLRGVPQGLSSALFTTDSREAGRFLNSPFGSDCGIANVNIGTSGAEIGGAFGGEKATGGGREAGSDAWKQYMRRQTQTEYYGDKKPELAQGVVFDLS